MIGNTLLAQREFDYDFIGFTYKGKHSIRDFDVYRVSDGSRYNFDLVPTITDKTIDIPGNDGMYFFNSFHKQRQFSINIAFNHLTETKLRELRRWFNGKEVGELIFDESPYKAYSAKVTGTPTIKAICFDEEDSYGSQQLERVYKGEGTIQFTCYLPYAYTVDWCWTSTIDRATGIETIGTQKIDGRVLIGFKDNRMYQTYDEWVFSAGLVEQTFPINGKYWNNGDVPAPFVVTLKNVPAETVISVGEVSIKTLNKGLCNELKWDSRTGLVLGDGVPIDYEGNSCGAIPADGEKISFTYSAGTNAQLDYKFWYY